MMNERLNANLVVGDRVRYYPVWTQPHFKLGAIASGIMVLGDGTRVVHVDLDEGRRIYSAALRAIERIEKEEQ